MRQDPADDRFAIDRAVLKAHGVHVLGNEGDREVMAAFALRQGWHVELEHSDGRWWAFVRHEVRASDGDDTEDLGVGVATAQEAALAEALAQALDQRTDSFRIRFD